jgi:hypothetical protein
VAIPGGFRANQHENRLRSRYAVLAALDVAGYAPDSSSTIRYVRFDTWPPSRARAKGRERGELIVPFEICREKGLTPGPRSSEPDPGEDLQAYDAVVILWVEADALADEPYERLQELIEVVLWGSAAPIREGEGHFPDIRFLGPTSSDDMKTMVETNPSDPPPFWRGFRAYSSWATADPALMSEVAAPDGALSLERVIASDLDLVRTLVEELGRRGIEVDPCAPDDQPSVALVAEWDTFYGRALPLTFAAYATALCQVEKDLGRRTREHDKERTDKVDQKLADAYATLKESPLSWPPEIERVIYLQGLDGQTNRAGTQRGKGSRKEGETVEMLERPEGNSQLDYVRRMALDLRQRGKGKLRAIGILGSDVYDKLLLIQALRDLFPHAVLFTTDLDARFLHPTQIPWTRNLIVASSFGLRLDDRAPVESSRYPYRRLLQVPPFRDSYQTSLFFAALRALESAPPKRCEGVEAGGVGDIGERDVVCEDDETYRMRFASPKVYEIGRTRAHRLQPPETHAALDPKDSRLWLLVATAVALGVVLRRLRYGGRVKRRAGEWIALYLIIGVPVLLGVSISLLSTLPRVREPYALTEGISIWPTEILRLLATFVALYYLIRDHEKIRDNNTEIAEEFGLSATPSSPPEHRSLWGRLRWLLSNAPSVGGERIAVGELWAEYLLRGKWTYRWIRTAALSVLYVAFAGLLFSLLGQPAVPYRGVMAFWADRVALIMSVVSFVLLMFYVVDAVLLRARLVRRLSLARSKWPDEILKKWSCQGARFENSFGEWLNIRLIARRTEVVGSLVMGPFVVLFLMIISRLSYFDRWDWPLSLIAIMGVNSVAAVGAAVILRRSAERTRAIALDRLRKDRVRCLVENDTHSLSLLDRLLAEVESLQRGAFAPFTQQPVMRALLVPFGGIGTAMFLEFLALSM